MIGFIYKITSPSTNMVYIGSTGQKSIQRRYSHHLNDYLRFCKGTIVYKGKPMHYKSSFEIIQYGDSKIELLSTINYETKSELHEIEGQYILQTKNVVNKVIPGAGTPKIRAIRINSFKIKINV